MTREPRFCLIAVTTLIGGVLMACASESEPAPTAAAPQPAAAQVTAPTAAAPPPAAAQVASPTPTTAPPSATAMPEAPHTYTHSADRYHTAAISHHRSTGGYSPAAGRDGWAAISYRGADSRRCSFANGHRLAAHSHSDNAAAAISGADDSLVHRLLHT